MSRRPGSDAEDVAALFVASLGLLMTERVELTGLRIFPEPHKGTRGGPSDARPDAAPDAHGRRWVELSHPITAGMVTYPGLPGPEISPHLTREDSRERYAPGTEFAIDRISMVGNTGTYLDSPYHRYAGGTDLAGLPLTCLADLPTVVVRTIGSGSRAVDVGALASLDVTGRAVLLHTGGDRHWGTSRLWARGPYLTEAGARWLVDHGARLVGIDSVNIDDTESGGERPAHTCAARGRHPGGGTSDRAGSTAAQRSAIHRCAAAHRGLRHVPGAGVRRGPGWPGPSLIGSCVQGWW